MKTSQSALCIATLLTVSIAAVFSWTLPAAAQEAPSAAPADEISCSSNFGNPVDLYKKNLHLVAAPADEIANVQKSKPEITAGPFTGGKFAFDRVDIYLVQTKRGNEDSAEGSVSLYARASQNQKESWFKVAQDKEAGMANYDFFDLTIGDAGDDSGENADENSTAGASFAVKKLNAPIFKVSWWKHEMGVNTFAQVRKMLVLDFRTSTPKIMATLQCVNADGGGACGDYDNSAAPTTTLACNWDSTKADFLCTSTATGDYTVPITHRFYLASETDAAYAAKEGDPPTLETLGAWSAIDRSWAAKNPDIPGLGPVSYLTQYSRDDVRGTAVLFASRGRDSSEARFFVVIVDPQGPTLALEIRPQPLVDENLPVRGAAQVVSAPDLQASVVPAEIDPAEKFADDVQPSFQVKTLETLPNVSVWRVTAKQGNMHEVVWLAAGRNPTTSRFVFSAVRIASENGEYAGCGSGRSKPFAAVIERREGSLDTLLDVEPSHRYDLEGKLADSDDQGQPNVLCPTKIKLSWNNSIGFVRDETDTHCPDTRRARKLSISDAGEITARPDEGAAADSN
jgi:hypothetical protein